MSAFKGTPGPWEWEEQILVRRFQTGEGDDPRVVGEWDEAILAVLDDLGLAADFVEGGGKDYCDWSVNEANARLIAAAPELLEALIRLEAGGHIPKVSPLGKRARAAITKATGGAA